MSNPDATQLLLVQTSFLGDTILSTPVIAGINKIHPRSELWMMTTPAAAQLVERDPLLAGVIPFDKRGAQAGIGGLVRMARRLRAMRFDRVYSLHRSARTALLLFLAGIPRRVGFRQARLSRLYHERRDRDPRQHDVLRNLSLLAGEAPLQSFEADLRLFAPRRRDLNSYLRRTLPPPRRYVVLVPGSAWETKRWSAEGFRRVALHFAQAAWPVVLLGSQADIAVNRSVAGPQEAIDLAGRTSVAEAMFVVANAALVVCNDSMALHLASAFKTPSVAIFCATVPAFGFAPWRNRAIVVEKQGLSCRPCRRHGGRRCPTGTEACMREVDADEVIRAAETVLGV